MNAFQRLPYTLSYYGHLVDVAFHEVHAEFPKRIALVLHHACPIISHSTDAIRTFKIGFNKYSASEQYLDTLSSVKSSMSSSLSAMSSTNPFIVFLSLKGDLQWFSLYFNVLNNHSKSVLRICQNIVLFTKHTQSRL